MELSSNQNTELKRNSSIELIKIVAIILIIISHVVQTLHCPNEYIMVKDYMIDIISVTTNIKYLILLILRYSGVLGNTIFFVCSAWFLLDSTKVNKKKILKIILDVWVISIIILLVGYFIRDGNIDHKIIIKLIFPTLYANNWYITCYLIFYSIHTFLNLLIKQMNQKTLLKSTIILLTLYVFINFIVSETFFTSPLILWVTIYFAVAYIKYYLKDTSNNIKLNIILFIFGIIMNIILLLLTNYLGVNYGIYSNLLIWAYNCNPFLILAAISLFNIARNIKFKSNLINYISGLSLLIYIIHENLLLRTYYRPMMWQYIYERFGYEHIFGWVFILVLVIFIFGLITSIIYKITTGKIVTYICDKICPKLQILYRKLERVLFQIH